MGSHCGRRLADGHGRMPILFVLLGAVVISRPLSAATIRVPAMQPTVQAASAAAASGDTILIAPGSHAGGVFVNGKSLTFASEFIATGDTSLVSGTILNGVVGNVCNGAPGCAGNAAHAVCRAARDAARQEPTLRGV